MVKFFKKDKECYEEISMKPEKQCEQLSRFLQYMLGRAPDEFGLYLDKDGWCKIKHILQVLSEESGWKHIRQGNIREIFVLTQKHGLEMQNDMIRIKDRSLLPVPGPTDKLPKLLFTYVRQRAYPHVHKKGVMPLGGKDVVVMAGDDQLALRIGKRLDPKPIKLTVNTHQLIENGNSLEQYGESLFLTSYIPTDCFSGPPLPDDKKKAKKHKPEKESNKTPAIKPHENYGAFFPQFEDTTGNKESRKQRSKKEIQWKKERRQKKRR